MKNFQKIQEEANTTVWQYCTTMKAQLKQQGEEIIKLQSQLLKILKYSNCSNEMDLNDVTMASDDDMQTDIKGLTLPIKEVISKSAAKEVVKKKVKRQNNYLRTK